MVRRPVRLSLTSLLLSTVLIVPSTTWASVSDGLSPAIPQSYIDVQEAYRQGLIAQDRLICDGAGVCASVAPPVLTADCPLDRFRDIPVNNSADRAPTEQEVNAAFARMDSAKRLQFLRIISETVRERIRAEPARVRELMAVPARVALYLCLDGENQQVFEAIRPAIDPFASRDLQATYYAQIADQFNRITGYLREVLDACRICNGVSSITGRTADVQRIQRRHETAVLRFQERISAGYYDTRPAEFVQDYNDLLLGFTGLIRDAESFANYLNSIRGTSRQVLSVVINVPFIPLTAGASTGTLFLLSAAAGANTFTFSYGSGSTLRQAAADAVATTVGNLVGAGLLRLVPPGVANLSLPARLAINTGTGFASGGLTSVGAGNLQALIARGEVLTVEENGIAFFVGGTVGGTFGLVGTFLQRPPAQTTATQPGQAVTSPTAPTGEPAPVSPVAPRPVGTVEPTPVGPPSTTAGTRPGSPTATLEPITTTKPVSAIDTVPDIQLPPATNPDILLPATTPTAVPAPVAQPPSTVPAAVPFLPFVPVGVEPTPGAGPLVGAPPPPAPTLPPGAPPLLQLPTSPQPDPTTTPDALVALAYLSETDTQNALLAEDPNAEQRNRLYQACRRLPTPVGFINNRMMATENGTLVQENRLRLLPKMWLNGFQLANPLDGRGRDIERALADPRRTLLGVNEYEGRYRFIDELLTSIQSRAPDMYKWLLGERYGSFQVLNTMTRLTPGPGVSTRLDSGDQSRRFVGREYRNDGVMMRREDNSILEANGTDPQNGLGGPTAGHALGSQFGFYNMISNGNLYPANDQPSDQLQESTILRDLSARRTQFTTMNELEGAIADFMRNQPRRADPLCLAVVPRNPPPEFWVTGRRTRNQPCFLNAKLINPGVPGREQTSARVNTFNFPNVAQRYRALCR